MAALAAVSAVPLAAPLVAPLATGPATLDTGNNAWMLVCAALVLLMTPGLAFFYGGMVRRKNVINMLMMSFSAMGTVGLVYVLWGYSMSFAGNTLGGLVGNPFTAFGLRGLFPQVGHAVETVANSVDHVAGVSALTFAAFQLTFAIITVALISGAVADRMKFSAWLVLSATWVTVTYFPLAHMVWGGGLLSAVGPLARHLIAPMDFAGGTVVHIDAGVAGVVLAVLLGRRRGHRKDPMRPHNVPFVMLGAGLLWFGWFGFNAGSAGAADGLAGLAWINTSTAASAAMLGWLAVERVRDRHATGVGAASGAVAGLVAITPGAGFLSPVGAIAVGLVAGPVCAGAIGLKNRFGLDDSLDVGGVHLVGGVVGTLLIGFFSTSTGLCYGHDGRQLLAQLIVVAAAIAFAGTTTLGIGLAIRATIGLRADGDDELEGLDVAVHGESAYDFDGGGTSTASARLAMRARPRGTADGPVAGLRSDPAPAPAVRPAPAVQLAGPAAGGTADPPPAGGSDRLAGGAPREGVRA